MQHIKRWITSIILIPILLWILIKGNTLLLAVLVSCAAVFATREYLRIIFGKTKTPVSNTLKIISYATSMALIISASMGYLSVLFLILTVNLIALAIFVLSRFAGDPDIFDTIAKQVLGIIYIPVSLSLLIFIKDLENGTFWIIWLLVVIFANDTGAFYTGTFLGKTPLAPRISPKKTIEGSAGGLVAAVLVGFVFCQLFFHDFSMSFSVLPAAFLLAITGQIGDLFESAMKRASNIKDSGRILPGHGGILDRIDGLLPAIPVLYVYLVLVL